ncbi:hypothetical protein F7R02_05915 [Xanthomonas cissicola]|nr:hypothetical protein F7R02_05915 [Xanthomonas cissicola]
MRVRFLPSARTTTKAPNRQSAAPVRGDSAAGDRLFGSTDILSDSPSRHIRVPLSADPRPRCRFGMSSPWLRVDRYAIALASSRKAAWPRCLERFFLGPTSEHCSDRRRAGLLDLHAVIGESAYLYRHADSKPSNDRPAGYGAQPISPPAPAARSPPPWPNFP